MAQAPLETVAAAMRERGISPDVNDARDEPTDPPNPRINVRMADPYKRYPDDTVWPPLDGVGWLWGDRFQFTAPADATPEEVADAVADTVRARP